MHHRLLRLLLILSLTAAIAGCRFQSYSVDTSCERTAIGNYNLKWESYPPISGVVKIDVADSPSDFDLTKDHFLADAEAGIATYVTKDNFSRKFFRINFPKAGISKVMAARSLQLEDNTKVWDLGGFYTSSTKQCTRWGVLYSAHKPSSISAYDKSRFKALNIRYEVVLCGYSCHEDLQKNMCERISLPSNIHFDIDQVIEAIHSDKLDRTEVLNLVRNLYFSFVNEQNEQFTKALQMACTPQNIPILFESADVPGRVGFLSALILSLCDVPDYHIVADFAQIYEPSTISRWQDLAQNMTPEQQMALSALLQPNEEFLREALNTIRSRYGSVSNYLTKHLDFGPEEQNALKKAVLVQAYDRME